MVIVRVVFSIFYIHFVKLYHLFYQKKMLIDKQEQNYVKPVLLNSIRLTRSVYNGKIKLQNIKIRWFLPTLPSVRFVR